MQTRTSTLDGPPGNSRITDGRRQSNQCVTRLRTFVLSDLVVHYKHKDINKRELKQQYNWKDNERR